MYGNCHKCGERYGRLNGINYPGCIHLAQEVWSKVANAEQLELFPELVAQWEEDANWYTILRQRVEGDDT